MGVAVLSGVIDSLEAASSKAISEGLSNSKLKWESHTPGTLTPTSDDPAIPTRFIACVRRQETARKLERTFAELGRLGSTVEVVTSSRNADAVKTADVVVLGYAIHLMGLGGHFKLTGV